MFQSKTKTMEEWHVGYRYFRNGGACGCFAFHIHGVRQIRSSPRGKACGKAYTPRIAITNPKILSLLVKTLHNHAGLLCVYPCILHMLISRF
jgi:hypothetical protein